LRRKLHLDFRHAGRCDERREESNGKQRDPFHSAPPGGLRGGIEPVPGIGTSGGETIPGGRALVPGMPAGWGGDMMSGGNCAAFFFSSLDDAAVLGTAFPGFFLLREMNSV